MKMNICVGTSLVCDLITCFADKSPFSHILVIVIKNPSVTQSHSVVAAVSYLPFNKYPVITYSLHWHLKCFLQECKRNTADPTYSNSYYKPCIYEKIFLLFNFKNSYLGETTPHPFYLDEKIKNTFFHTVALCFHKIVTKNNEDWWGKNSSLQIIAWIWVIFQ